MLSPPRRGRPSLTVTRDTGVSTVSLTGVGEDDGDGDRGPDGDAVGDAVDDGDAECVNRVGDSLQETNDPAAVKRTAAVASALPAMSPSVRWPRSGMADLVDVRDAVRVGVERLVLADPAAGRAGSGYLRPGAGSVSGQTRSRRPARRS